MTELLEALDRVYNGIQHLQGVATVKENLAIMLDALQVIEQAYAYVKNHPDNAKGEDGIQVRIEEDK